jgi:hypothetical protein
VQVVERSHAAARRRDGGGQRIGAPGRAAQHRLGGLQAQRRLAGAGRRQPRLDSM